MSIFRFTRKGVDPLSGRVDAINLTYTTIKQAFDETVQGPEENVDFVEYTLFLLALSLSVHTWSQGKMDIRVRNKFINDHVLETINYVRQELPYARRPRFFRGSIVHIPDMKNWLGSLVVKKMQGYLRTIERDGFTAAFLPIVKQAEKDVYTRDFHPCTDERYIALQARIETIARGPADRV